MASTIKLKTSTDIGSVPESLSKGEVAINVADGVWYYGGDSAVQQNFKFGSVTVTGDTSLDGKLVVTGNTVMNGTLSATTSLYVGNGNGTISASTVGAGIVTIENGTGSNIPLSVKGNADQSASFFQISDNEDTILVSVPTNGKLTSNSVDFGGGTIDNTPIGASTRSSGKFTTMDVNSTLVVTGNTVLNGTLSATTSLKVGNGDGTISAATITSSGDMTSGGDVYTDVVRRQSDSSTTTKIKLDDETIKCFGSSSSVWSTKVSSQQLEVGQGGAGVISAATVTGLGFVGTQHMLRTSAFYVNDNPLVQNSLYFGHNTGSSPMNWNDPQAAGGTISSVSSFTIVEDDMNHGIILPYDISKIEVQCSLKPNLGTGDDFSLVIYTGIRSDDSNTALTLTKVAIAQTTFTASQYVTNDLTYTADLNKDTMIYVGVGSEDATDAKNARGIMNITVTQR